VSSDIKVKDHFDEFSESYENNFGGKRSGKVYEFQKRGALVGQLTGGRSGRLLDAATGTGQITLAALEAGQYERATLVDISAEMLDRARLTLQGRVSSASLEFIQSDVFDLQPAPDLRYDVVLCVGLIAHTGRLEQLLRHLTGFLAPGGIIVLQTSVANHAGVKLVRALAGERFRRLHGYQLSYFMLEDIERAVTAATLRIRATERFTLGLPFGDAVSGRLNWAAERFLEPIARRWGAEALLVLERRGG
jgi:ubiquinone/menaquinone biosynthesis C-methylase UbiE